MNWGNGNGNKMEDWTTDSFICVADLPAPSEYTRDPCNEVSRGPKAHPVCAGVRSTRTGNGMTSGIYEYWSQTNGVWVVYGT